MGATDLMCLLCVPENGEETRAYLVGVVGALAETLSAKARVPFLVLV